MVKKILIVDDSQLVHKIYGTQLRSAGFDVIHAQDGIDAINTVFSKMPDLILLDIHMPKINGYQVCRLLKDHPSTKHIPIIIATGMTSEHGVVTDPKSWSFQTGADGYIEKGVDDNVTEIIKPYLKESEKTRRTEGEPESMSEIEIMSALSHLLDKQLYLDVTRLKELDERKNAFVANVSHELKSPLAVIKGYVENMELAILGPITEKQGNALKRINQTVDRLNRLIINLLDIAKIEAGQMALNIESFDCAHLISDILDTYSELIEENHLSLERKLPDTPIYVEGDKDRLSQVFINLLSNAIKYTPENSIVSVSLMDKADDVRFEIEDNSPGMSPENLDKIFDKFTRISAEKREGTGLGLPIAKDIVVLHKGKIWAESKEGKGTKFVVELPKLRD